MIETNGHKPYACGVVLHPLIDAMIALRERDHIAPETVSEIRLRVHPFVLSITDVVEPSSGLQSKFSTVHSAAIALVDGAAGIAQYSDARARDPVVAALRRKVTAVAARRWARTRLTRASSRPPGGTTSTSPMPAAPPPIP